MKLDLDRLGVWLLDKFSPWLNVSGDSAKEQFSSHFFSNAALSFFLISIPWKFSWTLVAIPFGLTLFKELKIDGHWKDLFSSNESGRDGRTDLLSRGLGCLLPLITLLWRCLG